MTKVQTDRVETEVEEEIREGASYIENMIQGLGKELNELEESLKHGLKSAWHVEDV